MEWRLHLATRPILGLFIKDKPLDKPVKPRYFYVVKHQSLGLYLLDPYRIKNNSGDPRKDWGKYQQAWRFPSWESAQHSIDDWFHQGVVRRDEVSRSHHK